MSGVPPEALIFLTTSCSFELLELKELRILFEKFYIDSFWLLPE